MTGQTEVTSTASGNLLKVIQNAHFAARFSFVEAKADAGDCLPHPAWH